MAVSTVHKILTRYGCPPLTWTDPATGTRIRGPRMSRRATNAYVHDAPGDLIHVDIKKLGRIPDGGGWRIHGRGSTQDRRAGTARDKAARAGAPGSRGYAYIHHAVDDHSRLAYSEIHADERKETAVGFWRRARAFFAAHGIIVRAVLTDNGACYRSKLWAKTLTAAKIKHRRTRPYRPQTNGKVERFNRTLLEEWAYAHEYRSEAERAAAYPGWLHTYNRGPRPWRCAGEETVVSSSPGSGTERRLHSQGSSAKHEAGTLVMRVTTRSGELRSVSAGEEGSRRVSRVRPSRATHRVRTPQL